ncbi:hypothetical protein QBC38DRAFT_487688 [Podospora fimiseda]|uniref:DUF676 domain-containing protein n=1 Tax=Podospora fimiseda TaxID=252190 RepID=A0AAN7GUT7_9PEZI|nr:hypothetical protein QBC38DRAFT_487688 [Podospora fimiseda]
MAKRLFIQELYNPKDFGLTSNVDIVLVHGLDGDPVNTWKSASGQVWPQTLLPEARPHTRVLSFSYNGDITQDEVVSFATIRDNSQALLTQLACRRDGVHADRPIIFVAHCLGGLIVKQALRFAFQDLDEDHRNIATATRGLLFFGTPNLGTDKAQIKRIANGFTPIDRAVARIKGKGKTSGLVQAIIQNSEDLREITEDFVELGPEFPIASYFETRPWPGTDKVIVDKTSSVTTLPGDTAVPVDGDHVSMCQFETADDDTFRDVCKRISKATNIQDEPVARETPAIRHVGANELVSRMRLGQDKTPIVVVFPYPGMVPQQTPRAICEVGAEDEGVSANDFVQSLSSSNDATPSQGKEKVKVRHKMFQKAKKRFQEWV